MYHHTKRMAAATSVLGVVMRRGVVGLMLAAAAGVAHGSVQMDFVTVGNPGNANDSAGYGAVGYVYRISKYEVTNGQYREFLSVVTTQGDPFGLYNNWMGSLFGGISRGGSGTEDDPYVYSAKGGDANWDNRPVNCVSWYDAARFTNWLTSGNTELGVYAFDEYGVFQDIDHAAARAAYGQTYWIPTEDEWYKAASHKNDDVTGNYWDYPTSSDSVPSNDLVNPDPGNNANFYQGGHTIGHPYYTTEVGDFENSASPYGTFDQGGNVSEWWTGVTSRSCGLRGGFYGSDSLLARSRIGSYDPTSESAHTGFRVASNEVIPEPGSIVVWFGLYVTGLLWWRRRK